MYLAQREQTWQEELGESKAPDFALLGAGSESGKERASRVHVTDAIV